MTKITSDTLADMRACLGKGETTQQIARRYGLKDMAVYQRLRRDIGAPPLPGPANDNNPHRMTRMVPRNGGCSTLSGEMPVTLVRIPSVDGLAGDAVAVAA
jgi:hypothetical protein